LAQAMGLKRSAWRDLATPAEEALRWTDAGLSAADDATSCAANTYRFLNTLCNVLSEWFGWSSTFSSWEALEERLERRQQQAVDFVNSQMFAAEDGECRVASLRIQRLEGLLGPELPEPGWFSIFTTSYAERWYNEEGRVTQQKSVNWDGTLPPQQVPSLADLGVQGALDRAVAEATEDGRAYLLRLDQSYSCHQRDPPLGQTNWKSLTVLLSVGMVRLTTLVVQLSLSPADAQGWAEVLGLSLAGTELARVRAQPADADLGWLRCQIAARTGQAVAGLRLVLPDNSLAQPSRDAERLADVFPPEGEMVD